MGVRLSIIYDKITTQLPLEVFCGRDLMRHSIVESKVINILGLELNGYFENFQEGQIQLIDEKGFTFLMSLNSSKQDKNLSAIFSYNIPAVLFAGGVEPDERFCNIALANNVPILTTRLAPFDFIQEFERELDEFFAPRVDYRGTMMEVFGLGVLISGKSNVGKSESAMDLLQRGHRMIGDDIVEVTRRSNKTLVAKGKYPISHRMELRGIGIVDVVALYGVSAVKEAEKVELIVKLERWEANKTYERLGLEQRYKDILGVSIPYIEIPVAPGRNTAMLVEVAAMNYRLRERGIVPAEELNRQVMESYRKNEEDKTS
jgi:HPr kinase/phosphorylase